MKKCQYKYCKKINLKNTKYCDKHRRLLYARNRRRYIGHMEKSLKKEQEAMSEEEIMEKITLPILRSLEK